jgi:N-acetylglucosamine kinase-like BadF-type ATPase
MTGLYGAFEEEDGIILICGTGSVLLGKSNDKIYRVGGWGRIIGDYGSGYEIGKKALIEIVKEYDLSVLVENESVLSKKIKDMFKIDKQNIVRKVFHENFEIQKITPVVLKCAKEKDKTSLKIIDESVEGLLYHLHTFLKISRRKKPIDLAFIGSIIENKNMLSEKLRKQIDKIFKNKINVVPKKHASAHGAAFIAKKIFQ